MTTTSPLVTGIIYILGIMPNQLIKQKTSLPQLPTITHEQQQPSFRRHIFLSKLNLKRSPPNRHFTPQSQTATPRIVLASVQSSRTKSEQRLTAHKVCHNVS